MAGDTRSLWTRSLRLPVRHTVPVCFEKQDIHASGIGFSNKDPMALGYWPLGYCTEVPHACAMHVAVAELVVELVMTGTGIGI